MYQEFQEIEHIQRPVGTLGNYFYIIFFQNCFAKKPSYTQVCISRHA